MTVTRHEQHMTFWRGLVVSCFCFCCIPSSRLFIFLSFKGGLSFPELGGLSFLGLSFPELGGLSFLGLSFPELGGLSFLGLSFPELGGLSFLVK